MSSFDDLGRALRDDAATNAPRASALDVDAVAHAARARRRPRQWAAGTLSVVAALGLGGLALQSVTPPPLIAASESADTATAESADGADLLSQPGAPETLAEGERSLALLTCGVTAPSPSAPGVLTLSVHVPPSARTAGGEIDGVATLTNNGRESLTITTPAEASGSLGEGGLIVTESLGATGEALNVELAAGGSIELPLRVSTVGCGAATLVAGEFSVIVALEIVVPAAGGLVVLIADPSTVRLD